MTDALSRAATALAAAETGGAVALGHYRANLPVERKGGKTDFVTRADREAEVAVLEAIRERYPGETVVAEESASATAVPDAGPAWVVDPIDGTNNFVRDIPLWATAVAAVVDGDPVAAAVVLPAVGDAYVADADETRRFDVGAMGGGGNANDAGATGDPDDSGASDDSNDAGEAGVELSDPTNGGDRMTVSDRVDPDTMAVAPTIWWGLDRRDEYAAAASEVVHRFGDLARFRSAQVTLAMVAAGSLDATFTNLTPNAWDSVAGAHLVERAGGTVTDVHGDPWRHDSEGFVASNGERHGEVCAAARAVADVADAE